MRTITKPINTCTDLFPLMQTQLCQAREVQEAIRVADNDGFATDHQVDAVFEKYGVSVSDGEEVKLDHVLFYLTSDQFQHFTQVLDTPDAANQGFARLMSTQALWAVAAL